MSNIPIPPTASPDVKEAFRAIEKIVERLLGGNNVDWHGRRVINAGDAVDPQDYVTLRQIDDRVGPIETAVQRSSRSGGGGTSGAGGGGGGGGGGGPIGTKDSIEVDVGELHLVGDVASPGNNEYYGTDGSGNRGWQPVGGGAGADYVVMSDGATPTPSPMDDGFGNFMYIPYTP